MTPILSNTHVCLGNTYYIILKKCFLGTMYTVMSLACSNLSLHNSVLPLKINEKEIQLLIFLV